MKAETRERQYQVLLEQQQQEGLEHFGLMSSQVWRDDPRRIGFLLARCKFVAKVAACPIIGIALHDHKLELAVPPKAARHPSFYTLPLHFKKVLAGSEGGDCRPETHFPKLVRLCEAGRLRSDSLVSRRYRLEQISETIEDLKQGRAAGRCMVWMEEPPKD